MSDDVTTTTARFTIEMAPDDALLAETARFSFHKTWSGGVVGTSTGLMLSAGDPRTGAAGYVGIETVHGSVDGRAGTFALMQLGSMSDGESRLIYEIVPGSATVDLAGLTGTVEIVSDEGEHEVVVRYRID